MKIKSLLITLVTFGLMMVGSANAATINDVTSTAYKYVNTNNAVSSGEFTDSSFSSSIQEAYTWYGASTNISDGSPGFISNLNSFFQSNGFAANYFNLTSATKVSSGFENPITGPITGILLKQSTASLLVLFNTPVSDLYWRTVFPGANGNGTGISHYVLLEHPISEVPVPAALWMFAPALLGFAALRKKQKLA